MKIVLINLLFVPSLVSAQTRFMYDANGNNTITKTKGVAGNCTTSGGRLAVVRMLADDSTRLMQEQPVEPTLRVSPNPTTGLLVIDYYIAKDQPAGLQLMDGLGKVISILSMQNHNKGYYRISYNMQHLASQTYYLVLRMALEKPVNAKVLKL